MSETPDDAVTQPTHKCGFKGCEMQVPIDSPCCDSCYFELHVKIRELQGFSREEATIEYQREQGDSTN